MRKCILLCSLVIFLLCIATPCLAAEHEHLLTPTDIHHTIWRCTSTSHTQYFCRQGDCLSCGVKKLLLVRYGKVDEPHQYLRINAHYEMCSDCLFLRPLTLPTTVEYHAICKI